MERGFCVLEACWVIVKGWTHSWYKHHIINVMYVCIVKHNMIIDAEGPRVGDWSDDEGGTSADRATSPVSRDLPYGVNEKIREEVNMCNQHGLMRFGHIIVVEIVPLLIIYAVTFV